ncbi:MAG TPA: tRNA adenosine(34) deaminase TadA [Blastocatellia bacterium]|nr:tRNA adenosine(34) deaminase TadA [Blastocatellia bacterium]
MSADDEFMREALAEALTARERGEVPVGAVVVFEGAIVGRGRNAVIGASDPTAHAEIVALRDAALRIGNYRLTGATLYSTIEPCAMCAGAIVHARIARLVYGAEDAKAGAVVTHFGVCTTDFLNHRVTIEGGILENECREMIQSFFREKRKTDISAERCESG